MLAQGQYQLVNANEDIVRTMVLELMEKNDMCRCDRCQLDVCAIVLNHITGHYVTTRKGEVIGKALRHGFESNAELLVAVTKAIERVKDNPQHDA